MSRFPAVILATALAGCNYVPQVTPYRIEVQQGNLVTQEMVSQLKLGMTKDQVRFILGTPLIVDPFHTDRWDYVFARMRENSSQYEQRRITVFFEDTKLLRIEGDVVPGSGTSTPPPVAR